LLRCALAVSQVHWTKLCYSDGVRLILPDLLIRNDTGHI
jgi:hypothetical protein